MEAEKAEAMKSYNNSLSFVNNILTVVSVAAVALLGFYCFPVIVNFLQVAIVCFDWLRNYFYVFVVLNGLIVLIFLSFRKSVAKNEPDLYDQYFAAVPTVVRAASSEYNNNYRVTEVEDDGDDYGYNNKKSNYKVIEPVKTVKAVKECNCCDRVVVEANSKSYRRTRSEKKKKKTKVEYRRTESERVRKTASWKSESMDGLSSEEFQMTVETFITQKKRMLHYPDLVVDQWQNDDVDQWQNGVVDEWRNGVVQWKGTCDKGTERNRHRSRSNRLVGGSGSTGSGSYLAITN